jgi:GT2 family glycosyltransferase
VSARLVSVIVPTFQRRDSVKRLLMALKEQSFEPDSFEVLVVIDGSDDGTEEAVAETKTSYCLRAIFQPNRGRAAACNTGVQHAEGTLVILLDDDMEPAPGFITAHWQAHQGQKRLGVVGAAPVRIGAGASPVCLYIARRFKSHLEKLSLPGYQLNLRDFYSGNFSILRKELIDAGLFDEDFKIYGNEDLELSYRLRKSGISIVFCSDALAYQNYEKDFSALAQDNVAKGRTAVLFVRKHPEIYSELKIGTYNDASKAWRLLRTILLQIAEIWTGMPWALANLVDVWGRLYHTHSNLVYQFALDYFFWLGVKREQ